MISHMERLPVSNPDTINAPTAMLMRPQIVVIFDRLKDEMLIGTPLRKADAKNPEAAWDAASARLEKTVAILNTPLAQEESA